jgi:hypothetical protein
MIAKREYTVQWADEYECWNTVDSYSCLDSALERFAEECNKDPDQKHRVIATKTYEIATYSGDPNGDGTPL